MPTREVAGVVEKAGRTMEKPSGEGNSSSWVRARMASWRLLSACVAVSHLCRVDSNLALCNLSNLYIVENLHISFRHLHADIVLGLLQVLRSRLKVQLVQLYLIRNLETSKERNCRTKAEAGRAGRAVGIGIVERQATSKGETLRGRGAEVWQS